MTKIILFSHDSGVSDNITNIIKAFENDFEWYFFAYKESPAWKLCEKKSLNNILIDMKTVENMKDEILKIKPNFIYLGTSWQNKVFLDFIKLGKELNISTVVAMDHWVNYRERFGYPEKNWRKNLPDFITVNDKYGYKIAKDFDFKNIIKLKFNTLLKDFKELKNIKIKEKNQLLYVSEPTKQVAQKSFGNSDYWGFNEFEIAETLCENLDTFQVNTIMIRLHPSDKKEKYDYLLQKYKNIKIKIQDPFKSPLLHSLQESKIVIGIDGFVLYEAMLLGKRSISYIPSNKRECFVPLYKQNTIKTINKNIKLTDFKSKQTISEVKNFGVSFNKAVKIILKKQMKKKYLKAAVIGCGNIGGLYDTPSSKSITTHAHAYVHHKSTKLHSCCDLNIKNLQNFQNIWGRNIKTYASLEKMLKKENLDIVSIATDTSSHFEILKRLLSTDIKYIICEKPFVSTLNELYQVQKLLKHSDKKLIINFIRCFDPTMKKVKKLIKSNKLGAVLSFNAFFNKGIYHNGSHLLSLIEYLMQDIKSIEVTNKLIKENDIYGNFIVKTKSITGTITNFDKTDFSIFTMNIVLEKGYIEINNSGFEVNVYKSKKLDDFKGFKHLKQYKQYKNSLKNYAINSLKFLLEQKNNKQLKQHISISKKLLIIRDSFLKKNTRKIEL